MQRLKTTFQENLPMLYLNKKTNAFTIAEMLVVLVISGIVMTITLLVLSLVQGQIRSIQAIYKKNTEIRLLERGLWQDFNKHRLFYNNFKQQLVCTSEKDTVVYTFNNEYIIRNSDTLRVTIAEKILFLDGEVVTNNNIDAMELQVSKEITDKKLFIFKWNDATQYMNDNGL